MKFCKKFIGCFLFSLFAFSFVLPQNLVAQTSVLQNSATEKISSSDAYIFADALNAYKNRDWKTSIFLFKKFHSNKKNITPDSLFMLIMAETANEQFKQAISDCDLFLEKYPESTYVQFVKFQKGKNLFDTSDFEKSIICLSDFCHSFPDSEYFVNALFMIAENFYFTYNFENATSLYKRIIAEFPDSPKVKDAQYRLDVLAQRDREEKLLYLLRQTGEDYLSSKESFERVLKQNKIENSIDINAQLKELRQQNESLDSDLERERHRVLELEEKVKNYESDNAKSIQILKEQAEKVIELLGDEDE